MPSGGLTTTPTINSAFFGAGIAAQIQVTTGSVNISNITVDGTRTGTNCPTGAYVGIFYSSGSSGTVNEVETRNQNCNGVGVGIAAENGAGAVESVTIENSNFHDNSYIGIITCSNQTPSTLTASIKGNFVMGSYDGVISYCNAAGSISSNFITLPASGNAPVVVGSPSTTVSGNTVIGGTYGIDVRAAAVVSSNTVSNTSFYGIVVGATGSLTSNHISNVRYGIQLFVAGATVKSNAITKSTVGIDFNCNTSTVTGNTINGAATGINKVPAAFRGVNKFYNVPTVRTGC